MRYLVALTFAALSSAVAAAPSTFQNSCKDIKLSADGSKINATCMNAKGTPVPASLDIRGVENEDGKLKLTGKKTSFQQTCKTVNLHTNDKHVTLTAICRKMNNAPSNTQLELMDIHNKDGVLTQQ